MPSEDSPATLVSLAGRTLVATAMTDAWEASTHGFARLLGRGDPEQVRRIERRQDEMRRLLAEASGGDLDRIYATFEAQWVTRLGDLLEEDSTAEAHLRDLVNEIQVKLPNSAVSAVNRSISVGRDMLIRASDRSFAAGAIYGSSVTSVSHMEYHRPTVSGQPVRMAEPPPLLVGRDELLAELDTRLVDSGSPGPRVVVLCGLAGAGKSSVALAYTHRHLAEVGVAWLFAAEDLAVMAAGFGELAAQLGALDPLDPRNPVASVHSILADRPGEWLLVFDNAPDRASVELFMPPAGRGRVLITSRNRNWPHGRALDVPVLDIKVAADFLVKRSRDPDRAAARKLAKELGGLPLALEQAAAYIQATGGTLAGYLRLFRERRADLLARGEPAGYRGTVATTWAVAFTRLEQDSPRAAGLLRLLACLAPDPVPLDLLLQTRDGLAGQLGQQAGPVLGPLLEDPLAAGDAIAALGRHSLINPIVPGVASVHRLVQAVMVDQMPAQLAQAWRQAAAAVIEAALPDDPEQPGTWPDFASLLPHAQAALPAESDGMARVASYLGYSGSYAAARELCQRVLEARERVLGAEDPGTLSARANRAYWTGEAGDAAAARDQYAALLPVIELVVGPEHPETLTARANLASWTGQAGDPAAARDQFALLLPVIEQILGTKHPTTLSARHGLAHWTGDAGDPVAARAQYAALLPVIEQVSGRKHPVTLTARANLAYLTGEAGDPAGARTQYAALLPVVEGILGMEHPGTLSARNGLARWTGEAGDPTGARDQYDKLLPIRERVSGPEHPDTVATRNNLAYWTRMAARALGPE